MIRTKNVRTKAVRTNNGLTCSTVVLLQIISDVNFLKAELENGHDKRSSFPGSSQNLGFMSGNLSPGSMAGGSFGLRGSPTNPVNGFFR
jgi:hypothetical protein